MADLRLMRSRIADVGAMSPFRMKDRLRSPFPVTRCSVKRTLVNRATGEPQPILSMQQRSEAPCEFRWLFGNVPVTLRFGWTRKDALGCWSKLFLKRRDDYFQMVVQSGLRLKYLVPKEKPRALWWFDEHERSAVGSAFRRNSTSFSQRDCSSSSHPGVGKFFLTMTIGPSSAWAFETPVAANRKKAMTAHAAMDSRMMIPLAGQSNSNISPAAKATGEQRAWFHH